MSVKPALAKGTRDVGPEAYRRRNLLFGIIQTVFEKYGFSGIETPAMEQLSTLTGKYGEEGDKLLFRILNSGNFLEDADKDAFANGDAQKLATSICEKGLRYDLTIPFARFVALQQHNLSFPFKRYQMQPVWRADRPQKGRYREFYQCDADVIGSSSLLYELECLLMYRDVFQQIDLPISIRLNSRKILAGLAEVYSIDSLTGFTIALDKLDKVGREGVIKEFDLRGIPSDAIEIVDIMASNTAKGLPDVLKQKLQLSEIGRKGIEEIEFLLDNATKYHIPLQTDITLARGLDYYTGVILEVKAEGVDMGSIGGGGRYDDLTGVFGLKGMSGIGISFGVERIYDILESNGWFEKQPASVATVKAIFFHMGEQTLDYVFSTCQQVREKGIPVVIYPEAAKLKKQFEYAEKNLFPFAVIAGTEEANSGAFQLKDLRNGQQETVTFEQLLSALLHA